MTKGADVMTTEDVVFGYRPPSSGRSMMANADAPDDDEELLSDDDNVHTYIEACVVRLSVGDLRAVIRSALNRP